MYILQLQVGRYCGKMNLAKSSTLTPTNSSQILDLGATDECRVCINNVAVIPIFGDYKNHDISMEITMFGGIQLNENDGLPKFICEECFKLLEAAIEFRKSAKHSDSILKRRRRKKGLTMTSNLQSEVVKLEFGMKNKSNLAFGSNYELNKNLDTVRHSEDPTYFKNEISVAEDVTLVDVFDDKSTSYAVEPKNNTEMLMLIVSDESEKLKTEIVRCKHCNVHFQSEQELEEHKRSMEHKRNYVMSFLPKKQKKKTLDEKKTVNPKDHKCEICNRQFTKLHYPRHMQTQHNVKMVTSRSTSKKECTVCKRMFHPVALNRHMKKVHCDEKDLPPKLKLECPVCKKQFSKDFYPLHIQRHKEGDNRNYICDQCGKKFFFKSTFYTHRLIHSNDLPHKCDYCPYRGRTKGLLKTHVRTHTGDYPYKCTQCDTRCLTKSNLNAHMQRHRGPIDFICDTCKRGFYSKLDLERHISVIHMGIKNHVCNMCGMAFGYRHGLMSHQLNVHKRAKRLGKARAVYLKLEEEGLLQAEESSIQSK